MNGDREARQRPLLDRHGRKMPNWRTEIFTPARASSSHGAMQEMSPSAAPQSLASKGFGNAYLLLMLTMLFWAGNSVVARGMHATVPPLALAWLRWAIATGLILPVAWPHLKRDWPVIRANWPMLALLGT